MKRRNKLVISLLLLVAVAWGIVAIAHRAQCMYYGYQTSREVKYAAFIGCLVQLPTGWTPRGEVRTINE